MKCKVALNSNAEQKPEGRGSDFTVTHTYLHWRTPLPGTKSSLSLLPQRALLEVKKERESDTGLGGAGG